MSTNPESPGAGPPLALFEGCAIDMAVRTRAARCDEFRS
jgi:hypothetical protein